MKAEEKVVGRYGLVVILETMAVLMMMMMMMVEMVVMRVSVYESEVVCV